MKRVRRYIWFVMIPMAAAAGWLWLAFSGCREASYRDLMARFQQASPRNRLRQGDEEAGWDFHLDLSNGRPRVHVQSVAHLGVVRVRYEDESQARALYRYVDYSHPQEIRTAGNVLYVRWSESLLATTNWLMAYDLASRRELMRCRIDTNGRKAE